MQLDGIHHITCITADAQRNVDFYARVLGLRMVKKTVNFDAPDVYHLYYGDERGAPGSILTFFEFPGAARGRAGAGMIHTLRWRVASAQALEFWRERLLRESAKLAPDGGELGGEASAGDRAPVLRFNDPEGLGLELAIDDSGDEPLTARAEDIPPEHALRGFDGVRVYGVERDREHRLLTETMGFAVADPGDMCSKAGGARPATYTTIRHRRTACRGPAPCITSLGAIAMTSTQAGASA